MLLLYWYYTDILYCILYIVFDDVAVAVAAFFYFIFLNYLNYWTLSSSRSFLLLFVVNATLSPKNSLAVLLFLVVVVTIILFYFISFNTATITYYYYYRAVQNAPSMPLSRPNDVFAIVHRHFRSRATHCRSQYRHWTSRASGMDPTRSTSTKP